MRGIASSGGGRRVKVAGGYARYFCRVCVCVYLVLGGFIGGIGGVNVWRRLWSNRRVGAVGGGVPIFLCGRGRAWGWGGCCRLDLDAVWWEFGRGVGRFTFSSGAQVRAPWWFHCCCEP
jgi:hypothetical protein